MLLALGNGVGDRRVMSEHLGPAILGKVLLFGVIAAVLWRDQH